jgi:Peptidase A4 family
MSIRPTPPAKTSANISEMGANGIDERERLALTREVVRQLRPAPAPPTGFIPAQASDRELEAHGFPHRPNRDRVPRQWAKWQRAMSRPIRRIVPTFAISEGRVHLPVRVPAQKDVANNASNNTWSGAVVTSPPPGETFNSVSATWTVPNPWPPSSAWTGQGWNDGRYHCSTWVGLDGYGINELLQAGTAQEVVVTNGQITSQSAYAWFEWWPAGEIRFNNFPVNPGDVVNCLVLLQVGSTTQASAFILNAASNVATSTPITAPSGSSLQGSTAEWIMEDPCQKSSGLNCQQQFPMPDFGASFFYDAVAGSKNQVRDVTDATLLNMVQGGTTLSTAVEENSKVLMVYAGDAGP